MSAHLDKTCFGSMCEECRDGYTFQLWSVSVFMFLIGAAIMAVLFTWEIK